MRLECLPPEGAARPAWADYDARVRATSAVGVWHETYLVEAGRSEGVCVSMPPFGLGAAFGLAPGDG